MGSDYKVLGTQWAMTEDSQNSQWVPSGPKLDEKEKANVHRMLHDLPSFVIFQYIHKTSRGHRVYFFHMRPDVVVNHTNTRTCDKRTKKHMKS